MSAKILQILILGLVFALVLFVIYERDFKSHELEFIGLDIGQGDATLIQKGSFQILIDGGPDGSIVQRLGHHLPIWDRRIDMLILTHPDGDHINGLVDVVQRYDIGFLLTSKVDPSEEGAKKFYEEIKKREIEVEWTNLGEFYEFEDLDIEILFPFRENQFEIEPPESTNDTSTSLRVSDGKKSILLTGDNEKKIEYLLATSGLNLNASILQVGHHGSKTSSIWHFLKEVDADTALISAGRDNSFGHPAPEILERLKSFNMEILRTDKIGDVVIH